MFVYRTLFLTVLALFVTASALTAQEEFDFGKIDQADLAMTQLESDTSAGAYVLHHSNTIDFTFSDDGPVLMNTVRRRVKILKRSGFNEADVAIYFRPRYENLNALKAMIHLPDGEEIKLKNKDFIREDYSDEVKLIKFTFPQITEGAIIEYTYHHTDETITYLPKFQFQEDIPVRWAEYKAMIPQYFRYVSLSNSHNKWFVNESDYVDEIYNGSRINAQKIRYVKTEMPAFVDQPYTNNLDDYLPQVYMQLHSVVYPSQPKQDVISTWPNLAIKLSEMEWFGKKYNNVSDVSKPLAEIEQLAEQLPTEMEKAEIAYRIIGRHMNWNDRYGIGGDDRLNKCWDKASGNSSEINMILLGVLQAMEIKAEPLLVSLRNRGAHIRSFPVLDQFDHLMVLAELDGNPIILDVNDPNRKMGLPRFSALNAYGWVANPENERWISIDVPTMKQTTVANITLDEEGMGIVELQTRMDGYYGISGRSALRNKEDELDGPLMRDIISVFPDAEFIERELNEDDDPYAPLSFKMQAKVPLAQDADDYIYLSPMVIYPMERKLVDTEERFAPVDIGYPNRHRYIAKVAIPEGYAVEELPENIQLRSEDNSVVIRYTTTASETEVSLNYSVELGKAVYSAEEYFVLKELFERAIELQESMFVFRKVK